MKRGHHHDHHEKSGGAKGLLSLSLGLMILILIIEVIGGIWTRSLALLSDAGHVFLDVLALALALGAIWLAERPASDNRTYGFHRLEVFSAFINSVVVLILSLVILWKGVERLGQPVEIKISQMLVIAVIGFLGNLFVVWKLHPHAQQDVNVRGAFLHAVGDAGASVAVLVGGVVVFFTGWAPADALAAILVAVLISIHAIKLLGASIHILLEGVPQGLSIKEILSAMRQVGGVKDVEDLHVWNICSNLCALSAHVVLEDKRMVAQKQILNEISQILSERFSIVHTTIQVESENWEGHSEESDKDKLKAS